jgi:hypothetical protein
MGCFFIDQCGECKKNPFFLLAMRVMKWLNVKGNKNREDGDDLQYPVWGIF